MFNLIAREVEHLSWHQQAALWFCTDRGQDWIDDEPEQQAEYGISIDDITEHIARLHVFEAVYLWTNARVRAYLDQE